MTHLWFVRHGPTHAKAMVGWTDLPADLSDTDAIARLNAYLPPEALLISSDLSRAAKTADCLQDGQRTRLDHDPDLREIHFGAWEMRTSTEIEAQDPTRIRAFWDQPGDVCPPEGEGWNTVCSRVSTAVDRLLSLESQHIIVVAHFGAILTQIQRAEELEPIEAFSHRIDPLSVTGLSFDGRWHVGKINHRP